MRLRMKFSGPLTDQNEIFRPHSSERGAPCAFIPDCSDVRLLRPAGLVRTAEVPPTVFCGCRAVAEGERLPAPKLSTPFWVLPGRSKLAKLKTLKKPILGSNVMRSCSLCCQLSLTSKVLSQLSPTGFETAAASACSTPPICSRSCSEKIPAFTSILPAGVAGFDPPASVLL